MRTIALNVGLLLVLSLILSCEKERFTIEPSGQIGSEEYQLTTFSELEVSDPFQVYITFSDNAENLRIEADNNLLPLVRVEQKNGKLSIELEDRTNIRGSAVLKAFLSTKGYEHLVAQGATQVYLQNDWISDRMAIRLEGASSLEGRLHAQQLDARLTGASHLVIDGSTREFELDATGASTFEGFNFDTRILAADLEGGCDVSLIVHERISVRATGGSMLYYKGNGTVEVQELSGGSQVIKVEW